MEREVDHKPCEAPLVAVLVVADPEGGRRLGEQLREEKHEAEDDQGVEQGVPHRQLLVHREAESNYKDCDVMFLEMIMVTNLLAETKRYDD